MASSATALDHQGSTSRTKVHADGVTEMGTVRLGLSGTKMLARPEGTWK